MKLPLNKIFSYREEKINVKQEIRAGITTFLAMSYIIAVNPLVLHSTGMPLAPLVTTTCISAIISTFLMAFYAKLPFALASGMGLNTFFAYTVCREYGISWQIALAAVFVEGIVFVILSLTSIREYVAHAIPHNLKISITAGIGLFIAFIGLQNANIIIANKTNLVGLGNFASPTVIIAFIGLVIITVLEKKKIKGSILIGIVVCTAIAWIYALIDPSGANKYSISLPNGIIAFASPMPIVGKLDFSFIHSMKGFLSFIGITFTFLFVDFFGTVGSVLGLATKAGLVEEDGKFPRIGKALLVDAVGTTCGSLLGTSAISTFVESSTGIAEGGKTGLTAFVVGCLFTISLFFSPLFVAIPSCATAPALIYVGYLMLSIITNIDFTNITEALPAFITIILMPLSYSIGDGIIYGILSYVVINLFYNLISKKSKRIKLNPILITLSILFIIKLI